MIRKYVDGDIDAVMQIWLNTNIQAHSFISQDYWKSNFDMVKEMMPLAEIYVHEVDNANQIDGFIGLNNDYIEGIFIKDVAQSKGTGKQLLDQVKKIKSTLKLNVYQKMSELNEIVTMYLDYASRQARRHIPMTMNDWRTKLDAFLMFNDADLLQNKGTVTAAIAKQFAESEFEKYRIIQDNLYKSDFDRLILEEEDGKTIRFFEVAKIRFKSGIIKL